MADINTMMTRWENGGQLLIGADTVKGVIPGSLSYSPALSTRIVIWDRATVVGAFDGDQQLSTLTFSVRGDVSATGLIRSMMGAGTNGQVKQFTVILRVPNTPGASAGVTVTFTNCWLAESPTYNANAGDDIDGATGFVLNVPGEPTYGTY